VLSSEIEQDQDDNGWHIRPTITYQYQAGGKAFNSNTLEFGSKREWFDGDKGRMLADEKAKEYPVGGTVEVHFNPSKPENAVLEVRTASAITWEILAVVIFCIGAGMGIWLNFFLK
jgi:hypothetical protein